MPTPLEALSRHGQSPWIDFIERRFVLDGELESLVAEGVQGVTSNPTIFGKAIAGDDAYDAQLAKLAGDGRDPYDAFVERLARPNPPS